MKNNRFESVGCGDHSGIVCHWHVNCHLCAIIWKCDICAKHCQPLGSGSFYFTSINKFSIRYRLAWIHVFVFFFSFCHCLAVLNNCVRLHLVARLARWSYNKERYLLVQQQSDGMQLWCNSRCDWLLSFNGFHRRRVFLWANVLR